MTTNDVLVILGCLVFGYVVVSFLIGGSKPRADAKRAQKSTASAVDAAPPEAPPQRAMDEAGREHDPIDPRR